MWLNKNDGSIIKKPRAVTVAGVQHPANIFARWSGVELHAIGIFEFTFDPIPNRRYYTFDRVVDTDALTVRYPATPKPIADVQPAMLKRVDSLYVNKLAQLENPYQIRDLYRYNELLEKKIDNIALSRPERDELAQIKSNATAMRALYAVATSKKKAILALPTLATIEAYENTSKVVQRERTHPVTLEPLLKPDKTPMMEDVTIVVNSIDEGW